MHFLRFLLNKLSKEMDFARVRLKTQIGLVWSLTEHLKVSIPANADMPRLIQCRVVKLNTADLSDGA